MLSKLDEGTSNVLGYEVKGKLTGEEFEALSKEFKVVIAKYDKAHLLLHMNEIPRMELGAVAEDLKLAPHASDIERYAIVGDSTVVEWVEKLGGSLISGEVKHFEDSQYEEAWRWIQA